MRWGTIVIGCAALAACVEPELEAEPGPLTCGAPRTAEVSGAALRAAGRASAGPTLVYLNRCVGGCAVAPGPDDVHGNTSPLVAAPVTLPEYPSGDAAWNALVNCVAHKFAPFDVVVTDEDPGAAPHFENVVAGRPEMLGLDPTIGGVASSICRYAVDGLSFTFAGLTTENPQAACDVAAHELGHMFGLEHELLCNDPMTYLMACGEHEFRRVDVPCGEYSARACSCGGDYQNSHLALLDVLGPRSGPTQLRPNVRITSPGWDSVYPGFLVHVEASDDGAVASVRARIGGLDAGTTTVTPYVFRAPDAVPIGDVLMEIEAVDDVGLRTIIRQTAHLRALRIYPDASLPDAILGDRPPIIGLLDAGAPGDAEPTTTLEASSCACATASSRTLWATAGALLLGWAVRRRRARLALAMVAALVGAGCEESAGIQTTSGELVFDPPPGTPLVLEPMVLTQDTERRARVRARNVGTAPVDIETLEVLGEGAGAFSFLGGQGSVAPGGERTVWLRFRPTAVTTASVTLRLGTTDVRARQVDYPVSARARAPCQLFATPVRQAFGDAQERTVELIAAGLSDCTIVRLSDPGDVFELSGVPPLPFTIRAGESQTLRIRQVTRTRAGGAPVRALYAFEADGGAAEVQLVGQVPIWDCLRFSPDPYAPRDREERGPRVDLPFELGVTERRISVTNRCASEAPQLLAVDVGAGFETFALEAPSLPAVIAPEASVYLTVRRIPGGNGGRAGYGELHLHTDDAAFAHVMLRARVLDQRPPHLVVGPGVDFGVIPGRGCASRVRAVTVFNVGGTAGVITAVTVAGDPAFVVLSAEVAGVALDPAQPFELPAGASAQLWIEARGGDDGPRAATLRIANVGPTLSVPLTARVEAGDAVEDHFTLAPPRGVDTVFIVDDSLSAASLRARLVAAVPAWIGGDQRAAAVAAFPDGGAPTTCPGSPGFLDALALGPAAFLRALTCALDPPRGAPRVVSGVGAALHFLEDYARTFSRPGARLSVVMVSDDDDASGVPSALAARYVEGWLGDDRPDLAAVHDVTPEDPDRCAERFSQRGVVYRALTAATGGLSADACAPDLAPALAAIAAHDGRVVDTFALSRAATAASLTVSVDGAPVRADSADGYTFDAARNTLTLHGAAAAPVGAEVVVRYTAECAPAR